jgi:streptogramin lyase
VLTLFISVFRRNYTEQTGVAFLTSDTIIARVKKTSKTNFSFEETLSRGQDNLERLVLQDSGEKA